MPHVLTPKPFFLSWNIYPRFLFNIRKMLGVFCYLTVGSRLLIPKSVHMCELQLLRYKETKLSQRGLADQMFLFAFDDSDTKGSWKHRNSFESCRRQLCKRTFTPARAVISQHTGEQKHYLLFYGDLICFRSMALFLLITSWGELTGAKRFFHAYSSR